MIIRIVCILSLASKQKSIFAGHDKKRITIFVIEFFYLIHSGVIWNLNFTFQREILQIDLKDEMLIFKGAEKRLF
jgi:hypothetical protein